MASTLLPQALCMISRTPCIVPKKLGFSTFSVSHSLSASNSSVSLCFSTSRNRSLFVRAESEAIESVEIAEEDEAAVAGDEEEEEVAAVAELEAEVEVKPPKKPRVKLGDIMGILNKRAIEASDSVRPIPDLRTGDIVEIKLEVPENRRRLSIYKGIVISKQNAGIHTTIRIRRIIAGIGVEIVFPMCMKWLSLVLVKQNLKGYKLVVGARARELAK